MDVPRGSRRYQQRLDRTNDRQRARRGSSAPHGSAPPSGGHTKAQLQEHGQVVSTILRDVRAALLPRTSGGSPLGRAGGIVRWAFSAGSAAPKAKSMRATVKSSDLVSQLALPQKRVS